MNWRKIALSRDQVLAGIQVQIVFQASHIFKKAGAPVDAALFTSSLPNAAGGLEMYFSPAATVLATDLIEKHGGVPCDPPTVESVSLSAGRHRAFELGA